MKKTFDISFFPFGTDHPRIQYSSKPDSGKVCDLSSWLRAWTAFFELTIYFHPHRLIQYKSIISRFARQFQDSAWILYDDLFRQKVSYTYSLPWEEEDPRLYNEILKGKERFSLPKRAPTSPACFTCGKPGHLARFCSSRSKDLRPCFKFNSRAGCADSNCLFAHSCGICKGGHPKFGCSNSLS